MHLAGTDVARTPKFFDARAPSLHHFQSSNTGCFLTSPSWRLELVHDLQKQPRRASLHRTRSARMPALAHAHPPRRFGSGRSEWSSSARSAEQSNDPFRVKFASYLILSRLSGYPLHQRCRGRAGGPKRRLWGRGETAEGSRGAAPRLERWSVERSRWMAVREPCACPWCLPRHPSSTRPGGLRERWNGRKRGQGARSSPDRLCSRARERCVRRPLSGI